MKTEQKIKSQISSILSKLFEYGSDGFLRSNKQEVLEEMYNLAIGRNMLDIYPALTGKWTEKFNDLFVDDDDLWYKTSPEQVRSFIQRVETAAYAQGVADTEARLKSPESY